ncbi:glycosyltransferase family 2 protein [Thioclava sp. F36-6]|uniref:glycosyltransferase family 2 protein n=1 Tax=Thioclava sp. F36-6 TaxID=1915316 RepID=UPI0009963A8C|nr:glycosyltransferase family 2 protein [Thioclava sp. F36-6]OOY31513.1 hypothetical protein BMI88_10515 [Thioclava sp. F36-6]
MTPEICVVSTAYNAEDTIGDAVRSALEQPEVAEVVVVDDASTDRSAEAAQEAAAGDARLIVLRNDSNQGPAAGRNRAIAASRSPFLAVLDADDFLLPGRFSRLLAYEGWDLIADNIAFVPADMAQAFDPSRLPGDDARVFELDLAGFVEGNMGKRGETRGELGFLKPLMSRAFLERHALRYDESLRLGEDFDFYVRMLARGAKFLVSNECGYAARVRENSLSGRHGTKDLGALMTAASAHLDDQSVPRAANSAMRRHHDQIRDRYLLRRFLDIKAQDGLGAAFGFSIKPPQNFMPIASGILRDKLRAQKQPAAPVTNTLRLLLRPED